MPRWARAADVLTVLLALAALAVAVTGGIRLEAFGATLSVTSWIRLFIWGALVAAVRHWFVPRPPLPARLHWPRPRHETIGAILPAFVVTRAAVLLVGLIAVYAIGIPESTSPLVVPGNEARDLLARYDTGWYLHIVQYGYRPSAAAFRQQNIAFFPLFPVLIRLVGELIGQRWLLAGFLVSMAAFAGALAYLYRLGTHVCRRPGASALAVALLSAYPFAVFYSAVYTESLFLLCSAGAFYHALRRQPLAAAGWALAAGLTRPNGVLLAIPLALAVAVRAWPAPFRRMPWLAGPFGPTPDDGGRPRAADLLMVAAPAIGLAVFSAYLWHLTGNPLAWMEAQSGWGREYRGLNALLPDPFLRQGLFRALQHSTPNTLNAFAGLFALALSIPVTRHYGLAFGAIVALNVVVPLVGGGPVSLGRFTSVLFPMFLYLADAVPERHRPYWLAAFGMGQALVATLFFTWRELF
ncbi:MAG: putative integral rane protein [Acidobacteria bacterium]|nr:putative integral rane protein [Acidobacteriota bacterium]